MRKIYAALLSAVLLALGLTGCSRDEEAARTPNVDFYIQYASERFGVDVEDISVVQYRKGRTRKEGLTILGNNIFGYGYVHVYDPVIQLEWNGKTVSFGYSNRQDYYDTACLRDDFYHDELYEGVREYYIRNLGVEDVIIAPEQDSYYSPTNTFVYFGYSRYLTRNDVSEVNDSVIEDFIQRMYEYEEAIEKTEIYVELKGEDPEAEVRELIDRLEAIDCKITIYAMKTLSGMSVYRRPADDGYAGIPGVCVEGYDSRDLLYKIRHGDMFIYENEKEKCTEYKGYFYELYIQGIQEWRLEENNSAKIEDGVSADG